MTRAPRLTGFLLGLATVAAIYATAEAIHHTGLNPFEPSPAFDASPASATTPASAFEGDATHRGEGK